MSNTYWDNIDRPAGPRFFSCRISAVRALLYLIYVVAIVGTMPVASANLPHPGWSSALLLAYAIGILIPAVLVLHRRLDLVEPIYWFSLMYYLVFPASVYLLITEFEGSEHLLQVNKPRLQRLSEIALGFFLVGFISFLAGYLMMLRVRGTRLVRLPSDREFSGWLARVVIAVCIAVGVANFLYLVSNYPGGMLRYLLDFGLRAYRYELIGGTVSTIGYQFLYAGVLLWLMLILRNGGHRLRSSEGWLFSAFMLFSIVVSISQGRMAHAITYLFVIAFLMYVMKPSRGKNTKYLVAAGGGIFLGVLLYFFRRLSVATITGRGEVTWQDYMGQLGYWIVDKGNVPNLPVLINLIDQGNVDGEYWYGSSYLLPFYRLTGLSEKANIGETLGELWFGQGGGLPPTIVGEAFVNFGYLGVPVVLFIAGAVASWFYGWVRARGEFIWYVVYLAILLRFLFMWPKGEASTLTSAIWQFLPVVVVYSLIRLGSRAVTAMTVPVGAR